MRFFQWNDMIDMEIRWVSESLTGVGSDPHTPDNPTSSGIELNLNSLDNEYLLTGVLAVTVLIDPATV
jgi:hypothetical protein